MKKVVIILLLFGCNGYVPIRPKYEHKTLYEKRKQEKQIKTFHKIDFNFRDRYSFKYRTMMKIKAATRIE